MIWGFILGVVLTTAFWLMLFGAWPDAAQRLHDWVQDQIGD